MAGSFRDRLDSLRQALAPFAGLGACAFHPVMVRPALGFALVPRPIERPELESEEVAEWCRLAREAARIAAGSEATGPGLVDGAKSESEGSQPQARKGLRGLSAAGKKTVEDLCALVRQDRGMYGLWTVTLAPEVAAQLDRIPDGVQAFGDVLRRAFAQALRRACAAEQERTGIPCPDHWWFVIEPQKSGRAHWHFVFRCKSRRGRPWLLGKGRLDRLIRNAYRTATGLMIPVRSAGNVQALRTDPGRYLSKYLAKGGQQNGADYITGHGWSLNMVPHQWWGCSRSALAMLRRYVFELPSYVVGWLSRQWEPLAAMGLLQARIWQPEDERAPSMVVGRWNGIRGLETVLQHLFDLAERAYPSGRTFGYT